MQKPWLSRAFAFIGENMYFDERMKKSLILWVSLGVATLAFVLPMYFFSNWNLSDVFLLPGAIYLSYLVLALVTRAGIFDTFRYTTINWFHTTFKRGTPKRYEDAYEYKQMKEEQRKENRMIFLPWLSYGLLCIILCIVFAFALTRG